MSKETNRPFFSDLRSILRFRVLDVIDISISLFMFTLENDLIEIIQ